jgi:hypothetical protein
MTPEEIQQKIEFILESQASSFARADRFDEQLDTLRLEMAHQKENIDGLMRLAQQLLELARVEQETRKAEIEAERETRKAEIEAERETRKAQIEAERETRKAEIEAERETRKAEIEAERETRKAQIEAERETRKAQIEAERAKIDRVEEMTKILRELLETNLPRPEEPPPASS